MGLLDFFRAPRLGAMDAGVAARDPGDDRWFEAGVRRGHIRVPVTVDRARQIPVVRDCLQILSESVAGLDFGVFRRGGGGRVERLDAHPADALLRDPNARQTSFEFLAQMVDDLKSWGDFAAELVFDARGNLAELRRLDPSRLQIDETTDGTKRFTVTRRDGRRRVLLEDEVWHIPHPPLCDEIRGRSPILDDGLEAIGVAIALQNYANSLFVNDATPPYALAMDGHFGTQDDKLSFLDAWTAWATGRNRHRPAVLEYGLKPHRMGLTAEEAQFLETRRELWLDITRIWRVPAHKVGILDRATFSNIEHQSLEFVMDTLRPILELIERSVTKFLVREPGVYFEFNVESLLRGDIKSRYDAYALARQWGWLSVNDIRRMEHQNGIGAAGDRYLEPLNMMPLGEGQVPSRPEQRDGTAAAIAFLRDSVAKNGGRPKLEIVSHVA